MRIPALIDKSFLLFYLMLGLLSTLVHATIIQWMFGPGFIFALFDAFTAYALLFLMLPAMWFVVRFGGENRLISARVMLNIVAAAFLLLFVWYMGQERLLMWLYAHQTNHAAVDPPGLVIRLVVAFLITTIVIVSLMGYHLILETRQALMRESRLLELNRKTELDALKNQLNPHFLYNSLNTISSLTLSAPEKARAMVGKLSDFLRHALRIDAMQLTTLRDELSNVERYMEIEKERFGNRLSYRLEVEEGCFEQKVPALILQPLFENAIKHGVQAAQEPVHIAFQARLQDNELVLQLSNAYDQKFTAFRREGVGLENVRSRLRLHFGNGQLLRLKAHEGVFTATMVLPALQNSDIE